MPWLSFTTVTITVKFAEEYSKVVLRGTWNNYQDQYLQRKEETDTWSGPVTVRNGRYFYFVRTHY
jgi:hypothetical protein